MERLPRLLIVEDDAALTGVIGEALFGLVESTHTASSLREAESLLTTLSFDVVLLDVALPDGRSAQW